MTATVGFFDGVHTGHRHLIRYMRDIGGDTNVITFDEHPNNVLKKGIPPSYLTTVSEKTELLYAAGVDKVSILPFTRELAQLSAQQFISKVLVEKYHTTVLVVGYNNLFGHNRAEAFPDYVRYGKQCGIEVIQATPAPTPASSSFIREAISAGKVEEATAMLGRPYTMTGTVVQGQQVGRTIDFPTANLQLPTNKLLPQEGVYAVNVSFPQHDSKQKATMHKGMMSISRRPTLGDNLSLTVEVHIIDFKGDLYEQELKVEVLKYLRRNSRFPSLEALQEQLKKDLLQCIT